MEKISLYFFMVKVRLRIFLYRLISIFSKVGAKKYLRYIQERTVDFGCKAIHKKWTTIIFDKVSLFYRSRRFRRELFLSDLDDAFVLAIVHKLYARSLPKCMEDSELQLLFAVRSFENEDPMDLYNIKKSFISSNIVDKKEVLKSFYEKSHQGETIDSIAQNIINLFGDDYEAIKLLAMNGSAPILNEVFLEKALLLPDEEQSIMDLYNFVLKHGLSSLNIIKFAPNEVLLKLRSKLRRPQDIEAWEIYLFECGVEIIEREVEWRGLKSEAGIQKMRELKNTSIIEKYKLHQ